MASNRQIGSKGEALAAQRLEEKGYRILDRNYRFERGEIDLVAFEPDDENEGGELVFVEVKTRSGLGFGEPEEAVSEEKQRSIVTVSQAWLHERKMEGAACRFDVVSVVLNQSDAPSITHHQNAFLG